MHSKTLHSCKPPLSPCDYQEGRDVVITYVRDCKIWVGTVHGITPSKEKRLVICAASHLFNFLILNNCDMHSVDLALASLITSHFCPGVSHITVFVMLSQTLIVPALTYLDDSAFSPIVMLGQFPILVVSLLSEKDL